MLLYEQKSSMDIVLNDQNLIGLPHLRNKTIYYRHYGQSYVLYS